MKFLRSLLKTKHVITLQYSNRQLDMIKTAMSEGFKAEWTGSFWTLTKTMYL